MDHRRQRWRFHARKPFYLGLVLVVLGTGLLKPNISTWFLAASLGNLLAGLIAGWFKADAVEQMPALYLEQTIMPAIAGVLLILLAWPIKKWMVGVK